MARRRVGRTVIFRSGVGPLVGSFVIGNVGFLVGLVGSLEMVGSIDTEGLPVGVKEYDGRSDTEGDVVGSDDGTIDGLNVGRNVIGSCDGIPLVLDDG